MRGDRAVTHCPRKLEQGTGFTTDVTEDADKKHQWGWVAATGLGRKITFDCTPQIRITEAIYSERQKIAVERLLGAANDDDRKWLCDECRMAGNENEITHLRECARCNRIGTAHMRKAWDV